MSEQNTGLLDIARKVLLQYRINPEEIQIIQQGGIKVVWKVTANNGTVCLKRLNKTADKALFSVEAQKYIKASGGLVPGVLPNNADEPITRLNDELFVLYEWVEGKNIDLGIKEDFIAAMRGLALFHKHSKGYKAPEKARISTKIAKWPEQYRSMINRMNEWKKTSLQNAGTAVYDAYLKWVDPITALGEKALAFLESSKYSKLSCSGSPYIVLCHQDYGKGNALLTSAGVCVLDLDGVTFELAARDLRKIILKTMESQTKWNKETMENIISWYEKENTLTDDERNMVYIDCLFPHSFFGSVKNQFIKNKPVKASDVEKIGRLEVSKQNILSLLIEGEQV